MLQLVCVQCHKVLSAYMRPSTSPCGHVFCALCLGQVIEFDATKGVHRCPRCGEWFTPGSCMRVLLPNPIMPNPDAPEVQLTDYQVEKGRQIYKFFKTTELKDYKDLVIFYESFASFVDELDEYFSGSYTSNFVNSLHGLRALLYPIYEKALEMPSVYGDRRNLNRELVAKEFELEKAERMLDRANAILRSREESLRALQRIPHSTLP